VEYVPDYIHGDNFEKTSQGFIDFLLLDTKGFPLIVLEAKSEDKNPLVGKASNSQNLLHEGISLNH